MAPKYSLRLFLDAGAGVCLWSRDEATKARFGYAVETQELGLPADVLEDVFRLIADYDQGFNWNDPAVADDASAEAWRERIAGLLPRLRAALGPDFTVEGDQEA